MGIEVHQADKAWTGFDGLTKLGAITNNDQQREQVNYLKIAATQRLCMRNLLAGLLGSIWVPATKHGVLMADLEKHNSFLLLYFANQGLLWGCLTMEETIQWLHPILWPR